MDGTRWRCSYCNTMWIKESDSWQNETVLLYWRDQGIDVSQRPAPPEDL